MKSITFEVTGEQRLHCEACEQRVARLLKSVEGGRTVSRYYEIVQMYTGAVVRLRSFAFVLALLVTAMPVLGVVCEMDCDQPPAISSECHESTGSPGGPTVRGAHHGCDHNHTTGSPALLANASVRDSVVNFVAISVPALPRASFTDARVAIPAMHGPPGLSGRSTSSHNTVLRI